MRQIIDSSGNKIKGLFRQADGSLVVVDESGYRKSKLSIGVVERLNSEVSELKEQLMTIMRKING